jgi:hypothetical protein
MSPAATVSPSETFTVFTVPAFRRLELVLHLHRFDDENTVAFLDRSTNLDQKANDLSRHCRSDLRKAIAMFCIDPFASETLGVVQLHLNITSVYRNGLRFSQNVAGNDKCFKDPSVTLDQ